MIPIPGLSAIPALLAKVPPKVWLALGVLGLLGYYRWDAIHSKKQYEHDKVEAKAEREASELAASIKTSQRLQRQQEITDAEVLRRKASEDVAARLRAVDERLRAQSAAQAASGSGNSAIAGSGTAAGADQGVLADLFGECRDRLRIVVQAADESRAAGLACERSYDSLIK